MTLYDYHIDKVARITGGSLFLREPDKTLIKHLSTDSRKVVNTETTLFFAISGSRNNGHRFIHDLYMKGVSNFIVTQMDDAAKEIPANFIVVPDTLIALQAIAAFHRRQFAIPVIAVTGSNGKTIIKEWLYQLLGPDKNIVRSPKSYNSQIGVPLSIWKMNVENELAIFEAGISLPGEMQRLNDIIHPQIGIFTNIGQAHAENFESLDEKVREKLQLFHNTKTLIYCKDYQPITDQLPNSGLNLDQLGLFVWSRKTKADLQVGRTTKKGTNTEIQAIYKNEFISIQIPFTDEASIENAIHCWAFMLYFGYDNQIIANRMEMLSPVAMRLELKQGINNCSIINDSYNSDIGSLTIALDFLNQQTQNIKHTLVLSDILQSGRFEENLYKEVAELIARKKIDRLVGIGPAISRQADQFEVEKAFFNSTEDFLNSITPAYFRDETILLKGARPFGFERIGKMIQQKAHDTVLEINLNAIVHNFNYFRSRLKPETLTMAMVKAFAYGSGSFEIANILQFHNIDYLAVAYVDEGAELRQAGITMPIMVMNPEEQSLDALVNHNLEPEIYSFKSLHQFTEALNRRPSKQTYEPFPIHIELETGLNRTGFSEDDINELVVRLKNNKQIKVASIFTHLAGSEDPSLDEFTQRQIGTFEQISERIISLFDYRVIRHVLNSAGVLRFPDAQFEMVRLGIGLYGVAPASYDQNHLQQVGTLRSTISQIKNVSPGNTVGYGRKGVITRESQIATVAIGYADGLNRKLGNRMGSLLVKGTPAQIIGSVCMDMCMIDVTDIQAEEGDEVIIFGPGQHVSDLAEIIGTIPYEILTNISQRVRRVYHHE